MDGAKFAKMLSDKHLFELDRMEYKYSVSSVNEFTELLRQNFAQSLPLVDFSSDELFYLPNLARISTNGMKQLLSAPASNQSFGLQAMTEEIHATFQIESIHSSRNSIRHILNGYAPRNEEESRIYGMKRGLDFIADRQNTITEENLHQLYQISTGDYLPDEDRLLPDHFYRHDVVYVVDGEESREGLPAQQLPDAMKRLVDFANAKDGINELHKAAILHFAFAYYRKLFKKSYSTEYLDFVCTDQEGKLIRPNFVTEHFDWLLRKYSLPRIRFHDLRHSCASLMVMNGVSMKQVQEWLGHSTFSTTADIYAHLDYKSKEGSAGVIAGLLETKK